MSVVKRRLIWPLFVGVFLLRDGLAYSADKSADSAKLIAAMTVSMRSQNYQGTVVLYKNGQLDTVKFSHVVNGKGEAQEHVTALNSPLREVLRDEQKVFCIYPETGAMVIDHLPLHRSFLIDFPESPEVLQDSYSYIQAGEETVALQPADIVLIKPRDDYRYARRIWIGKQNHLPLKYEMLDSGGKLLEQIAFTELALNPALTQTFKKLDSYTNPDLNTQHIHQVQRLPIEQAGFSLKNIPGGFKQVFFTRRKMRDRNELVEHMLLKDGLASVSVYVEKQTAPLTESIKAAGAINSYTLQIGDYQITAMGDVPANTVRYIAEGVELRAAHN